MPAILGIGMSLWLVYGLAREDIVIILANIVGTSMTALLVAMKIRYDSTG